MRAIAAARPRVSHQHTRFRFLVVQGGAGQRCSEDSGSRESRHETLSLLRASKLEVAQRGCKGFQLEAGSESLFLKYVVQDSKLKELPRL